MFCSAFHNRVERAAVVVARIMTVLALLALMVAVPMAASADALSDAVERLPQVDRNERQQVIDEIAATGDVRGVPILRALRAGDLYTRKDNGAIVITRDAANRTLDLLDPYTLVVVGNEKKRALDRIRVNNRLRRHIDGTVAGMTLLSPDPAIRADAVSELFDEADPDGLPQLEQALAQEQEPTLRTLMVEARAALILADNRAAEADRLAAIAVLLERGDRDALSKLLGFAREAEGESAAAARAAIISIENTLRVWQVGQNVWYGLSLGSVLLLAAIGLAITFGVMGVINMAHGEMVMLGAYTTFVVQEVIRTYAPGLFDHSLLMALPLAFMVSGAVGVAIERSVIQWLYGRPLETLLATWGISLILQQAVRSIFGASNREVGNPSWMAGAFEIGQLTITYNRLWIFIGAIVVFLALMAVLRYTQIGLQMRAVTQNRPMAGSMGIRSPWVDAMTFGLGSGIAGIAGVALSQIDNVSPNLGQSYIIDSFMVVVFGGVGNLWGTLAGALSIGVANKFLEPFAGAVLAKILTLVLIILFIQKRPRGLFALRGRAVES